MPEGGQQMCECAYCSRVGTVFVRKYVGAEVDGFVCLGGPCLPSGRLRALCASCVRGAVAAFARIASTKPAYESPKDRA